MVSIPRSPGVLQRPTTETGFRAPSIAQSQIIPNAISGAGQTIQQIGLQQQAVERREKEQFQATQALDYKNELRRFDNQANIRLRELPADQETINNQRQILLEEREVFADELAGSFGDDERLQGILKRERNTSQVGFEFGVDQELSRKKKTFGTNKIFSTINDLKDDYEDAKTPDDFARINQDLESTLALGLGTGLVTPKEVDRQQEGFRKLRKERALEIQNEHTFSEAVGGTMLLDSTDKDDRRLVDDNFLKIATKADNPIEVAEQISVNTGIIPSQAKKFWTSGLMNGNDSQKISAATTINDLIEANPSLESQFSSQQRALSIAIENRLSLGIPESDVVKFSQEEIKENKSQDRIIRTGKFNQEFGSKETSKETLKQVADIVDDLEDESGFFREAEAPDQMGLDTVRLARDFYLNEGLSMSDALTAAKAKVKSEWFITDIGEKRYQKFAPERFYTNMSSKEIQNQAVREVRKITLDELPNIKKEVRLQVIPDSIATGKPAYFINRKDNLGTITPVLDNQNLPLVFRPDVTKTEAYKKDSERRDKLRFSPEQKETFNEKRKKRRTLSNAITQSRSLSLVGSQSPFAK